MCVCVCVVCIQRRQWRFRQIEQRSVPTSMVKEMAERGAATTTNRETVVKQRKNLCFGSYYYLKKYHIFINNCHAWKSRVMRIDIERLLQQVVFQAVKRERERLAIIIHVRPMSSGSSIWTLQQSVLFVHFAYTSKQAFIGKLVRSHLRRLSSRLILVDESRSLGC